MDGQPVRALGIACGGGHGVGHGRALGLFAALGQEGDFRVTLGLTGVAIRGSCPAAVALLLVAVAVTKLSPADLVRLGLP